MKAGAMRPVRQVLEQLDPHMIIAAVITALGALLLLAALALRLVRL